MRMTDFPVLEEIREEYVQARYDGFSRDAAAAKLIESYTAEITVGADDDGLLFWIGLADAQYHRKELSAEIAKEAITALDKLIENIPEITPGDIERRREHYLKAPMPEKKVGKPRPKFRCEWNIGDTFAYKIGGKFAEKLGVAGKYALLRKVDEHKYCGSILPVVTVSLWDSEPLPTNNSQFLTVPILKIGNKRAGAPADRYEYRAEIMLKAKNQLKALRLQYLGNFAIPRMPDDEFVQTYPGFMVMLNPKTMDSDCCHLWRYHIYYTQGIIL